MQNLIQQLRNIETGFNSPCSREQLTKLEEELGFKLPAELQTLYRDHNGLANIKGHSFPMRFMPSEEVIDFHRGMSDSEYVTAFGTGQIGYFWTDDDSNYLGLYIRGSLEGKLCFLDHDEPMLPPRFRSLNSFYSQGIAVSKSENHAIANHFGNEVLDAIRFQSP